MDPLPTSLLFVVLRFFLRGFLHRVGKCFSVGISPSTGLAFPSLRSLHQAAPFFPDSTSRSPPGGAEFAVSTPLESPLSGRVKSAMPKSSEKKKAPSFSLPHPRPRSRPPSSPQPTTHLLSRSPPAFFSLALSPSSSSALSAAALSAPKKWYPNTSSLSLYLSLLHCISLSRNFDLRGRLAQI